MLKQIVSVIISHSIFISNAPSHRICLTWRSSNNNIYSICFINKVIQSFTLSKLIIFPSFKQLFFSLNVKMHHSLFCILYFPFSFKPFYQRINLWFQPLNSCHIFVFATLQKTIFQASTSSK